MYIQSCSRRTHSVSLQDVAVCVNAEGMCHIFDLHPSGASSVSREGGEMYSVMLL